MKNQRRPEQLFNGIEGYLQEQCSSNIPINPLFHAVLPSMEGPCLPLSVPEATVVSRDFITEAVELSPSTPPIFNKFVLYNSLH
jgi:hypothetical protein